MMGRKRIRLGAFDLTGVAGKGGMGIVWRGIHRQQRVPVAVKVVTAELARHTKYLTAFRNEVRAVASMNHTGIIMVFDHGEIDEETASRSGGRLAAGCPYLVMEHASAGSLDQIVRRSDEPMSWGTQRTALLSLLDALAHAHARGLVHCDLKPANVLLCARKDERPGLKLSDFGLARAAEQVAYEDHGGKVHGTPFYMAPEQIEGHVRDHGPWTDLYALGCLAFEVAAGTRPYTGVTPYQVVAAHMRGERNPFTPRSWLPDEFDDWLDRLLERDHRKRFQLAADAAIALAAIPDDEEMSTAPPRRDSKRPPSKPEPADTEKLEALTLDMSTEMDSSHRTIPLLELSTTMDANTADDEPESSVDGFEETPGLTQLVEDWRIANAPRPSRHLWGVGLGLYGLRAIPLVDREPERDRLWESVQEIRRTGRPKLVLLRGPAGSGKSRLARWLCERAHEVGGALAMKAVHEPIEGPSDGLTPMLSRTLRTVGLGHLDTLKRINGVLPTSETELNLNERRALAAMLSPVSSEEEAAGIRPIRFESPVERFVIVQWVLERMCAQRPMVLWLDDVQWGEDALAFARYLLRREGPHLPVLILATARDSALVERPVAVKLVQGILAHPYASAMEVGELPPEHRSELVSALLGLEPELSARVVARAGGNPLFAVQLIGDWVSRNVLEPSAEGFFLRPGTTEELPDDMHQVWNGRVAGLLARRAPADGVALELAAVLGQEVDPREWDSVCRRAGIEPPWALVEEMLNRRLAASAKEGPRRGWSFVHSMLRESIARRAREAQRLVAHHQLCAEMLLEEGEAGDQGRCGRHFLGAGDLERALGPLAAGVEWHVEREEVLRAESLLDERQRVMEAAQLPPWEDRWGEQAILRSQLAFRRHDYETAGDWATRALEEGSQHGWQGVRGWALFQLASNAHEQGELSVALERVREARDVAADIDDPKLLGLAYLKLGALLNRRGERDTAAKMLERAYRSLEKARHMLGVGDCALEQAFAARGAGNLDEARIHVERARTALTRSGSRRELAKCLNFYGEVARVVGDLEDAEHYYRESRDIYRAISSERTFVPMANLGLILLAQDRFAPARESFEEALQLALAGNHRGLAGALHVALLVCHAGEESWSGWEEHLVEARRLIDEVTWVDPDIAPLAERAGELADAADEWERAAGVLELARAQWKQLGRDERADDVAKRIARIQSR